MCQGDYDRYLGVHKRLLGAAGIPRFRSRSRHRIQKCHYARTGSRRHDRARNQPFCAISIRPQYKVVKKALPQTSWRGISGYLSNTAIKGSKPTSPRCVKDQISCSIHARIFIQTAEQVSPDDSPKNIGECASRILLLVWRQFKASLHRDRTYTWEHNPHPSDPSSPQSYGS